MRRCIHAILVGLLTLSLATDTARACWHLRHGGYRYRPVVVASIPLVDARCLPIVADEAVIEVEAASTCGCDAEGEIVGAVEAAEFLVSEVPVAVESPAESAAAAAGTGLVTAPEPTLAEPVTPALPLDSATSEAGPMELPQADNVAPVSVEIIPEGPAEEPEALPASEPLIPTAVPQPVPSPNIFDEVDRAVAGEALAVGPLDAGQNPTPPEGTAPDALGPAADEGAPAALESLIPEPEMRPETDATGPEAPSEAAAEPAADAAVGHPREPARRWIDQSGAYAVVGRLRAVREDGTCVIDVARGTIEVPREALSAFDRDYATKAAERLATVSNPEAAETAGL